MVRTEKPSLSIYTPPPTWGWLMSPRPSSGVKLLPTVVLLIWRTGGFNHLEGRLASSVHTGGHRVKDIFPPPSVSEAWIQDVKVTSNVYVFAPNYATSSPSTTRHHSTAELAQRGTSATPMPATGTGLTVSPPRCSASVTVTLLDLPYSSDVHVWHFLHCFWG